MAYLPLAGWAGGAFSTVSSLVVWAFHSCTELDLPLSAGRGVLRSSWLGGWADSNAAFSVALCDGQKAA